MRNTSQPKAQSRKVWQSPHLDKLGSITSVADSLTRVANQNPVFS